MRRQFVAAYDAAHTNDETDERRQARRFATAWLEQRTITREYRENILVRYQLDLAAETTRANRYRNALEEIENVIATSEYPYAALEHIRTIARAALADQPE